MTSGNFLFKNTLIIKKYKSNKSNKNLEEFIIFVTKIY